jgi:uncharacterized protein (TIGR03435 family)
MRGAKVTLLALIRSVYYGEGLTSENQYEGGPDWIRTDRWDFEAVAAMTPTRPQFNEMLRNLLADRFRLRFRREQRQLPIFALLVARDDRRPGPNLTSAAGSHGLARPVRLRAHVRPRSAGDGRGSAPNGAPGATRIARRTPAGADGRDRDRIGRAADERLKT